MPTDVLALSRRAVAAGISVIPVALGGAKNPAIDAWKEYQERLPSDAELLLWFGAKRRAAFAAIAGRISGHLEVLDCDEAGLFPLFCEACEDAAPGLLARLVLVETPRPGYQLWYRHPGPSEGGLKLARGMRGEPARKTTLFETRAEGLYAVAPGSHPDVHETRRRYTVLQGDPFAPPGVTAEERALLLTCARALDEIAEEEAKPAKRQQRDSCGGERPGDDFNLRADPEAMLVAHGWEVARRVGETVYLRRPGKERGWSASLNHVAPGIFRVFSANADPFEMGKSYDAFGIHAHLEHSGNFPAAARALRKQGLGERAQNKSRPPDSGAAGMEREHGNTLHAEDTHKEETVKPRGGEEEAKQSARPNQARTLVAFASDAELFHNAQGELYATVPIGERQSADGHVPAHQETWRLRSPSFKRWLSRRYYLWEGNVAHAQAMDDALTTLEGQAQHEGPQEEVWVRKADLGGAIYLDLGTPAWDAVEITGAGWRLVAQPPVRFRRADGMLPLARPHPEGTLAALRTFLNLEDEAQFRLLVGWLLGVIGPHRPYPVLGLHGEQGCAKTTAARVLQAIVDPCVEGLRREPKDERDLAIGAKRRFVVAFDNLSGMPVWLSDAFCCLSSGAGFATRTLHTDEEETIFSSMRPLLLTGIAPPSSASDLLDRSLLLTLPQLAGERRSEREFWEAWQAEAGGILGALLAAAATGLRHRNAPLAGPLPRMADFAQWVGACERGLPWERGAFLAAYGENRAELHEIALEASLVAPVLADWIDTVYEWKGSVADLLDRLGEAAGEGALNRKGWPQGARALSNHLRRIAPNLRAAGIEVEFGKSDGARFIAIRRRSEGLFA